MTSASVLPFGGPDRPDRPDLGPDDPATPATIPSEVARQVPAAVYTACTGADGAWLYASPQIEAILGYRPQEFLDDPGLWARLLHPDDRDWVLADEEAAHAPELRRSYAEYRLIARDGRVVWVLDDITVLHEPGHGSVQHGLLFDITARKRTELLLAEQAELMERIAREEALPETLRALAASMLRVTGAPTCLVVVNPADDGPERDRETYVAGDPHPVEADGAERVPFADLDGVPLGDLVVLGLPSGSDVRDDEGLPAVAWAGRIAALAVKRARQEQREARSYSLLEATLESTADGILVVDRTGRIAGFNRKFGRMWNVPDRLVDTGDDDALLTFVMGQLAEPESFMHEVRRLYAHPEQSSVEELVFADGRVFERYSQPQLLDDQAVGRVWSFRDISDYRQLEDELRRQAHTDSLTGLANRLMFLRELADLAVEADDEDGDEDGAVGRGVALLLIDVDDFKTVNDGLGHLAGDAMLVALAQRVAACVGDGNVAARLGGDEFAVLLRRDGDVENARAVAERIIKRLAEPVDLDGRSLSIRASIGIAVADDATPPRDMVRNADLAMYTAKRDGGACHRLYATTMHDAAIARLDLKADLGRAIEQGALDVVYQPVVRLGNGGVDGFEALARWQHPVLGAISPVEFIPLAEETGLIDRLGHLVLSRVCGDLAAWRAELGPDAVPVVSVNLSPQQLTDPLLAAHVATVLASIGVPADRICLEVTESGLGGSNADVTEALREIRALGVQLSLDDFGTGHSSLSRLGSYPFDVVKIDRSFVSRLTQGRQDRAVVEAVVRLAAAFALDVVAEGVETTEQADILAGLGCERVQGFLFSRPVAASLALDMLREVTVFAR